MKRYNDEIQIGQLDMFYLYFNINLNSDKDIFTFW